MASAATTITLDQACRSLRRELGVLAWAVLEDLAFDTCLDHRGRAVAITSVRRLASNVGINKDTAARALARLGAVGLLHRDPGSGGYVVAPDAIALLHWHPCPEASDAPTAAPARPVPSDTTRTTPTTRLTVPTIAEQTSLFS